MKPTVLLPIFPKEIENWWWSKAQEKWPEMGEEKRLNLLRQEIVEQSDRFNKSRSFDSSSYGSRDLSILAYGNFYFSRTWMAIMFAVAETLTRCQWTIPKSGPIRILDLGSGSGASGLACLSMIRSIGIQNPLELHAWDYSSKSLHYLKDLHRACYNLWPNSKVFPKRGDLRFQMQERKKYRYDLLLLGYSLNEIREEHKVSESVEWLKQASRVLKRSSCLIITEPAESKICRNLHEIMDHLVKDEKNFFHFAPYLNGLPCPMTRNDSKYFSHEVRRYPTIEIVEKINRPLHLEIREVKFGFSILGLEKPELKSPPLHFFRIISPVKKRKGTISFLGLAADGVEYYYEFQRRDMSEEAKNNLLFLERGDVLRIGANLEVKEGNRIRLSEKDLNPIFLPRFVKSKNQ